MFLATLAMFSSAFALWAAYDSAAADGSPGIWFLGSVALMLALLASALSLLLCAILYLRQDPARPRAATWLSLAALAQAAAYLLAF